jgi:hypothetical protein
VFATPVWASDGSLDVAARGRKKRSAALTLAASDPLAAGGSSEKAALLPSASRDVLPLAPELILVARLTNGSLARATATVHELESERSEPLSP